jgi:tetratricopeptide (TPR) repeat protein
MAKIRWPLEDQPRTWLLYCLLLCLLAALTFGGLYHHLLDTHDADAIAHVNLGGLHYRAGRWDQAIAHNQAALALGPSAHAQFNLGLAYLAKGDEGAARAAYAQGVARFGAEEGERIGAMADLESLAAVGPAAAVAGQILRTYWPAPRPE